jgi:mannose-6-phosphate isomerase-like protein (cupin superfamily)
MKIIHKNETKIFKNSEVCTAVEYPMDDKDINGAVIELSGRYPVKGRTMNEKCKEMAYVIGGSGKIVVEDKEIQLNEGDLMSLAKNFSGKEK